MEDEAKTQEPSWPTIGMTTAEVARSLRCDLKTVQDAIKDGGLPARLVGRGFRVEESALRQWLASGTGAGRRPPQAQNETLDEAQVAELRRLVADGVNKAQIARRFGVSRPTVYRYLRGAEPEDGSE